MSFEWIIDEMHINGEDYGWSAVMCVSWCAYTHIWKIRFLIFVKYPHLLVLQVYKCIYNREWVTCNTYYMYFE